MSKLRVHAFSISLDGFGAGPRQDAKNGLGVGGEALHEWMFPTRTFRRMQRDEGGSTGVDEQFTARGFEGIGAWIMGRNMFGPIRGPWPDEACEAGGSTRLWSRPWRPPMERTCGLGAVCRQFVSTSRPDSLTTCLAPASTSSRVSICRHWAMNARSMSQRPQRLMSS